MRRLVRLPLCLGIACLVACSDSTPLAPSSSGSLSVGSEAGGQPITVMTRNLYIGTDVDLIIAALASPDPNDDIPALFAGIAVLQKTSFRARASGWPGRSPEPDPM